MSRLQTLVAFCSGAVLRASSRSYAPGEPERNAILSVGIRDATDCGNPRGISRRPLRVGSDGMEFLVDWLANSVRG
jgi:hypothetical protein